MVKQFVIVQDIMRDVKRNIRIYCKFMKGDGYYDGFFSNYEI